MPSLRDIFAALAHVKPEGDRGGLIRIFRVSCGPKQNHRLPYSRHSTHASFIRALHFLPIMSEKSQSTDASNWPESIKVLSDPLAATVAGLFRGGVFEEIESLIQSTTFCATTPSAFFGSSLPLKTAICPFSKSLRISFS